VNAIGIDRNFQVTKVAQLAAITLFVILFITNSYVCDDAVISFRSIHNYSNGYGLTFNPGERVQTFTGPLFTVLILAIYLLVRLIPWWSDLSLLYTSTILASFLLSLASLILVMKTCRSPWSIGVTAALLFSSQAFMLNCSSGLETPMTLTIVALFFVRYFKTTWPPDIQTITHLFLLASFATVNRLDAAVLFFPACAHILVSGWREYRVRVLLSVGVACIPMITWLCFALAYYGFLFPNSYYAKLGLNISADLRHLVGGRYLISTLRQDPVTSVTIITAGFVSLTSLRRFWGIIGAFLYLYYVFDIGGDFIGYRFFAAPFLISVLLLNSWIQSSPRIGKVSACALLAAFPFYNGLVPFSPFRSQFDESPNFDVRSYFRSSNLVFVWRFGEFPAGVFHAVMGPKECEQMRRTKREVFIGSGGLFTFCRGPHSISIDPLSITDPLIARLPAPVQTEPFIPGHIAKPVPRGYVKSLRSGRNEITDPNLHRFYEDLRAIISGPLFSSERWKAIVRLNFTSSHRYNSAYRSIRSSVG
jgi:arabinofuranosyltransferase